VGSLAPILRPRAIAVIGASREPGTIGYNVVAHLVRGSFAGPVYPVNPKATSVAAVPAFPTLDAIPGEVDLGVVVVPKQHVQAVAEQAIARGVRGLVVISAGFREVGGEGVELERRLTELVRAHGVRMVGPNCMGVLNADPDIRMNATFAPSLPRFGQVGFVSQSGAIGLSVLDYAREYGIGIAQFVSVGNKSDVSGNDLLLEWEDDPAIGTILMYVENFGNPQKFLEIAGRISRTKPIIAVKSGRSRAGAQAARSHTGALAASDAAVDALITQSGVLRAGSVEELFDLAMAFESRRAPSSRRTVVLTNAGGPGILAADAAEQVGLDLPELAAGTVTRLGPLFPAEASLRNPLDMIASATPEGYREALAALLADPGVDSAIAIYVPLPPVRAADVTGAIAAAAAPHPDKPVFAVLMGHEGLPQGRADLHRVGIPAYVFPESAARALEATCRWGEWRRRPPARPESPEVDRAAARALVDAALGQGRGRLGESEALDLLAAYGVPVARALLATTAEDAVRLADQEGYPVVAKVVAPAIVHKTEAEGVQVDLRSPGDVHRAWDVIMRGAARAAPGAQVQGVVVQRMVRNGRELIVGMTREARFGPLVAFGLGGVLVEVVHDVTFRMAPLTRQDARDMIRGIRGVRLLDGVRGAPPVDFEALEEVLLRVGQLAVDFPEIAELDVNPLLAFGDGVVAVDGRVALSPSPAPGTPPYSGSPEPVPRPTETRAPGS
jgi:acetyl coenzyme A synthetase (ADP forming)-like protein